MQILKETGIDWRERRLISNLYMAQSVKVRLNRGETRSVKTGRGVRQGCCEFTQQSTRKYSLIVSSGFRDLNKTSVARGLFHPTIFKF